MWLMVFALLASQLLELAESPEPVAANCSAVKGEGARQYTFPDSFRVCDYCDIVAQQAIAVPSVPVLDIAAILLATLLTLALAPLARIDDSPARASRCTEPEASRECSTPLQNQC
ncbi:hypothetical protein GCT13_32945 [Paraburkholderia sp. CNPSo 3157]|uniref:DUF2946 domain-containing protein n=1 Tax=Paraburkholderia franconis TaxID=2654983 RepID=A0A7X1TJK0_9BURK|nr:hypothetical protein [Paraburkholderia franconis]MPW21551.1 hypothetical protein [Paraburkholderia franconis]